MSSNKEKLYLSGKVLEVGETIKKTDTFSLRHLVINTGEKYGGTVQFELSQDRCDLADGLIPGMEVDIYFDVNGRKWEKDGETKYFVSLRAWKIERVENTTSAASAQPATDTAAATVGDDDLPF